MTEAEIMKALECCRDNDNNLNMEKCFDECPYKGECACKFMADALDLINRKNAENEKLRNDLSIWKDTAHRETSYAETARTEAIKEFRTSAIARAKKGRGFLGNVYHSVSLQDIDEIAKEMGCLE